MKSIFAQRVLVTIICIGLSVVTANGQGGWRDPVTGVWITNQDSYTYSNAEKRTKDPVERLKSSMEISFKSIDGILNDCGGEVSFLPEGKLLELHYDFMNLTKLSDIADDRIRGYIEKTIKAEQVYQIRELKGSLNSVDNSQVWSYNYKQIEALRCRDKIEILYEFLENNQLKCSCLYQGERVRFRQEEVDVFNRLFEPLAYTIANKCCSSFDGFLPDDNLSKIKSEVKALFAYWYDSFVFTPEYYSMKSKDRKAYVESKINSIPDNIRKGILMLDDRCIGVSSSIDNQWKGQRRGKSPIMLKKMK